MNKDLSIKEDKGNESGGKKYRQLRLLGEGTFGKAYLVECIEDKVRFK